MAKTVSNLIIDTLPRLKTSVPGFTLYGAVNSITSLIYKLLLQNKSDLVATGDMEYIIPAGAITATVPTDFSSFAERPKVLRASNLTTSLVTALANLGLSAPHQATITTMLQASVDIAAIQAIAVLDIPTVNVQNIAYSLLNDPTNTWGPRLDPLYLDHDESHDWTWWSNYAVAVTSEGYTSDYYGLDGHYEVINNTFYLRPKLTDDVILAGRYYAKPTAVTGPTDTLQYSDISYEIYREGVMLIMAKGLAIPEAEPAFAALLEREIMTVVNARHRILPDRRMTRRNWI